MDNDLICAFIRYLIADNLMFKKAHERFEKL